jgi:hypothetical protein
MKALLLALAVTIPALAQDKPPAAPKKKPKPPAQQVAHKKPTAEQIRKFNQLEKKQEDSQKK